MLMPTRKSAMKRKLATFDLNFVSNPYILSYRVVCFATHDDLRRALDRYQGKEINGRRIKLIDDSEGGRPGRRLILF